MKNEKQTVGKNTTDIQNLERTFPKPNLQLIGRGAYGRIYSDIIDGQCLVLKQNLVFPEVDFSFSLHELDILLRTDHPNIIQLVKYEFKSDTKDCLDSLKLDPVKLWFPKADTLYGDHADPWRP